MAKVDNKETHFLNAVNGRRQSIQPVTNSQKRLFVPIPSFLYETAQPKVLLDDDVWVALARRPFLGDIRGGLRTVYCGHDEPDLHGIRGTGEVGIDLLGLVLVERDEPIEDVVTRRSVVWAACIDRLAHCIVCKW